jgi:hypothetical protein
MLFCFLFEGGRRPQANPLLLPVRRPPPSIITHHCLRNQAQDKKQGHQHLLDRLARAHLRLQLARELFFAALEIGDEGRLLVGGGGQPGGAVGGEGGLKVFLCV